MEDFLSQTHNTPVKVPIPSLYIKVLSASFILLLIVFFVLKSTHSSYSMYISQEHAEHVMDRLLEIKEQTQDMVFFLPDQLLSNDRYKVIREIRKDNPTLRKIRDTLDHIGENIINKNNIEDPDLYLYHFLDTNIKNLDFTLKEIVQSGQFDDISPYWKELIKISKNFANYSPIKENAPVKDAIEKFSLKRKSS